MLDGWQLPATSAHGSHTFQGDPPQLPTALPGDCHPTEPFSLALGSGCPVYPSCSSAWIHLCLYPEHKLILSLLMAEWC